MKVAMLTKADLAAPDTWGAQFGIYTGTAHCARALEMRGVEVSYLGPLTAPMSAEALQKQAMYKERGEIYFPGNEPDAIRDLARQVEEKINASPVDCILCCCDGLPLAYAKNLPPIVMFRDATVSAILDYYPQCRIVCAETRQQIFEHEKAAYLQARVSLFGSSWAAEKAIELFALDRSRVHVMPFGANIIHEWTYADAAAAIETRPSTPCTLAFIGNDWERKGLDIAVQVTRHLNDTGLETRLIVAGSNIPAHIQDLPFIQSIGLINDQEKADMLRSAHFLLLPTRAECFGFVLCEASAYGVPCLTTDTGGIPDVVQNGINGQRFSVDSPASTYSAYIRMIMADRTGYEKLATTSHGHFRQKFRWPLIATHLIHIIETILPQHTIPHTHFSTDWFTHNISTWGRLLHEYQGKPFLQFLEVGSFEGRSACWLLEHIVTHSMSTITCIDTFTLTPEARAYLKNVIPNFSDDFNYERTFDDNIAAMNAQNRVQKIKGSSRIILGTLPLSSYDCIYIDGSHTSVDVLTDAVLSWDLLKEGGILIFDDYLLTHAPYGLANPGMGIDAFLNIFAEKYDILEKGYQVVIRKCAV